MSPEEQNRVIHEFCGANKLVGLMKHGLWYRPNAQGYTGNEWEAGRYTFEEAQAHEYPKPGSHVRGVTDAVTIVEFKPLDYGNEDNLNPIREAEGKFAARQWITYLENLFRVVCKDHSEMATLGKCNLEDVMSLFKSTTSQRREAFVRTLGRWKE